MQTTNQVPVIADAKAFKLCGSETAAQLADLPPAYKR
jgi:hypothetical protein